jgi:hypothetical protein
VLLILKTDDSRVFESRATLIPSTEAVPLSSPYENAGG